MTEYGVNKLDDLYKLSASDLAQIGMTLPDRQRILTYKPTDHTHPVPERPNRSQTRHVSLSQPLVGCHTGEGIRLKRSLDQIEFALLRR